MILHIILIILGFILLIKGADFLVDGASNIAKRFHIPEIVIGLTIVAIGTSMPELFVSVTASLEGHSDLAIGNVVGSNIANLLLILGACAVIRPLKVAKETKIFEIPFTILSTILLFYICTNNIGNEVNIVTRQEGILLIIFCVMFIMYNLIMAKKGKQFNENNSFVEIKNDNKISVSKAILGVIVGIIGLKIGGDIVVNQSVEIAKLIGISEKLISLTIVAFSTSLPELITSITATKKGETDMAIGNILGSQIFNILLIIGVSALVSPINYSISYNWNIILLLIGSILLGIFPLIKKRNEMTRINGILFLIMYIAYFITLIYIT